MLYMNYSVSLPPESFYPSGIHIHFSSENPQNVEMPKTLDQFFILTLKKNLKFPA